MNSKELLTEEDRKAGAFVNNVTNDYYGLKCYKALLAAEAEVERLEMVMSGYKTMLIENKNYIDFLKRHNPDILINALKVIGHGDPTSVRDAEMPEVARAALEIYNI